MDDRRRRPSVWREPVEHFLELVDPAQVHLEEEAVIAGDAVALDHLRALTCDLADPLELPRRGRDANDRCDRVAERDRVDVGAVAADHTFALEALHTLGDGGRREVHAPPERGHREAGVALELLEDPLGYSYFVGSAVFHYLGPAFAVLLFALVPPVGVTWLRLATAAAIYAA